MKYINFKKIKIQNFLSVGSEPVEVDFKTGLHIITGLNKDKEDRRNGVGKSTIADAIYFAVFGDSLRDLKKDHIVNNINKKNCSVELDVQIINFDKKENLKIIRTLEPSKCYLYIDGEDKTRDSISNTTNFILKHFSCTTDIFQNCVIMTVNNTTPFMAKKKQEKRKFIEDIFNLGVFSNMLDLLKVDINEKKKAFEIETTKYDEGIKSLNTFEKQKKEAVVEKQRKHTKYIQRQKQNEEELTNINNKLSTFKEIDIVQIKTNIEALKEGNNKVDNNLQELRRDKTEKEYSIQQIKKQIITIGTEGDTCQVCLRKIEDHDRDLIKKEKKILEDQIKHHNDSVQSILNSIKEQEDLNKKINNKIDRLKDSIHACKLQQQEKQNLIHRADQLKQWLKMLDQDINDLENTTESVDKSLDEQKEKIATIKHNIEGFKNELNTLDVVKFVVSEEGVKSYVVKKILKLFNSRLAYYLKKMDANCLVTFNEYFEEEIVDNKGKPCSYFNFSGAERKNIDLACLFTFIDMRRLQGDVCFNFSIYDELFDSSLDERGVELVINLLKERVDKHKECIMVISHRKESIKAATGDVIFLEKSNGITRRVDYKDAPA